MVMGGSWAGGAAAAAVAVATAAAAARSSIDLCLVQARTVDRKLTPGLISVVLPSSSAAARLGCRSRLLLHGAAARRPALLRCCAWLGAAADFLYIIQGQVLMPCSAAGPRARGFFDSVMGGVMPCS